MDRKGMEEHGMRTRSFRTEDYNNRRVFLRSYPLHWGGDDEENNEEMTITNKNTKKKPVKKILPSIFHWGEGKVLVLRRFKHKFTIYMIACLPARLKSPTALISG